MDKQNLNQRRLFIVSYVLSIIAISMFIFATFFSNIKELQSQGIYWFVIASVCALLPTILPIVTKLKYKDIEIEFQKKLDNVEKRVTEVEDAFIKSFESLRSKEQDLPPSFIEQRNRHWDRYDEYMQSLAESERFAAQKQNSLAYLNEFGLTVRDLKERLAKLGYYKGNIDDVFSQDLAISVEEFQRLNNMRHIDGMFGELTFEKISEKLADSAKRTNIPS